MKYREYSEDAAETGETLGSNMLHVLGKGLMIVTLALCIRAMLGSEGIASLDGIAAAGMLSGGFLLASTEYASRSAREGANRARSIRAVNREGSSGGWRGTGH